MIRRVIDPAFDRNSIVCRPSLAQAAQHVRAKRLTLVKDVAHGAVINDHDAAEVRLNLGQIFDVSPIAERAVLPVVPSCKVLALRFQPVDYWVGVFLHRRCKDYQVVPLTHLLQAELADIAYHQD